MNTNPPLTFNDEETLQFYDRLIKNCGCSIPEYSEVTLGADAGGFLQLTVTIPVPEGALLGAQNHGA